MCMGFWFVCVFTLSQRRKQLEYFLPSFIHDSFGKGRVDRIKKKVHSKPMQKQALQADAELCDNSKNIFHSSFCVALSKQDQSSAL